MSIGNTVSDLIGNTPLVRIRRLAGNHPRVYGKLEYFNPGGSVKDRIALSMIEEAEKSGLIGKDTVVVEPTSGNTGIGLAMVCAVKGYRLVLTMPESASVERRRLMAAYGAELVLTPASEGMPGAIARAREIAEGTPGSYIPQQFDNPANPARHYASTAEEIWKDLEGQVDILVAGVGTGGTISGTGRRLRELNPDLEIVAVEPDDSAVLSGDPPGPHKIQGIGAGFVPGNLDRTLVSRIVRVTNDQALETSRKMMSREGIMAGISAGAAAWAAFDAASRPENRDKTIVFIVPDTGERYLSTPLFEPAS